MAFTLQPFPHRDSQDTPYTWVQWFNDLRALLNRMNETATSVPTTGVYNLGDFVKNSSPTELGLIGQKFIIFGWVCTASGSPGTWKEVRTLTGK